jgi:hypothetical protein
MSSVFEGAKSSGSSVKSLLPVAIGGAALLTGGIRSYTSLPEGYEGLRNHGGRLRAKRHDFMAFGKREGELYGAVGPGFIWHSPRNGVTKISVQDRNTELRPFRIVTANNKLDVKAYLTWGIVPRMKEGKAVDYGMPWEEVLYRAITAAENGEELSQNVNSICTEGLRHILREKEDPMAVRGDLLTSELKYNCSSILFDNYSVEIRRVNINDAAPTEADTLVNGRLPTRLAELSLDGAPDVPIEHAAFVTPSLHLVDQQER